MVLEPWRWRLLWCLGFKGWSGMVPGNANPREKNCPVFVHVRFQTQKRNKKKDLNWNQEIPGIYRNSCLNSPLFLQVVPNNSGTHAHENWWGRRIHSFEAQGRSKFAKKNTGMKRQDWGIPSSSTSKDKIFQPPQKVKKNQDLAGGFPICVLFNQSTLEMRWRSQQTLAHSGRCCRASD